MRQDIQQLYLSTFGYIAQNRAYPLIGKANSVSVKDEHKQLSTAIDLATIRNSGELKMTGWKGKERSLMGVPLYMPTKLQISKPGEAIEYYKLPNEPLIEISGGKNIVKTQFDEQDGTFKENFSRADWMVTIRGIMITDDGTGDSEEYPEDILTSILRILDIRKGVRVVNDMCTLFGIDQLAIDDCRFPTIPGSPGQQAYELRCYSDREFDLELKTQGKQV